MAKMTPPGSKQKEIPDPVAWMKAHSGPNEGSPGEESGESTSVENQEKAFGIDKPTQGDPANTGFQSVNSHGGSQIGSKQPQNPQTGGPSGTTASPSNRNRAGAQVGGSKPFGMPSRPAIARRLNKPVGKSKAASAKKGASHTGNLKPFQGFGRR